MARGLIRRPTMSRLAYLALAVSALALGCAGEAPPMAVDATGPDAGEGIDAAVVELRVAGVAKDYFTNAALSNATLASEGMEPGLTATSGSGGEFALTPVPPGSVFFVTATRANYRTTRGLPIEVAATSVTADQPMVSNVDARRQSTTLGRTPLAGTGVVFAELVRRNGMPLVDVPVADIVLVDALEAPAGVGPFVFGVLGDVVPNETLGVATAVNGRSRVGFLDVPPGTYTLKVTYAAGGGGTMVDSVRVDVTAEGASLTSVGGGEGMPPAGTRTFATDVYPRLQTAANGGLGCANCHTAGGAAAVLPYDQPAMMTYDAIRARPGVVDTATPAMSMLLTKPLYEVPANHPNATFLDASDPDYLIFLEWITQGARP
jgi:hypothetical protein